MDTKKKIKLLVIILMTAVTSSFAQSIKTIKFCDIKYEEAIGKDSITLYFKALDNNGKKVQDISAENLSNYLVIKENDETIAPKRGCFSVISTGTRIPAEYTFSVLVDLSIPAGGKSLIYEAICKLVESAPDSCVYVSFFGDDVTSTMMLTKNNLNVLKSELSKSSQEKYFYDAMYAKLAEFSITSQYLEVNVKKSSDYIRCDSISCRAKRNKDKNILFVFTNGATSSSIASIKYMDVSDYQAESPLVPSVYAFYYVEHGNDTKIEDLLKVVCKPTDIDGREIEGRVGKYFPANNMDVVLKEFQTVVNDQMYDYAFTYRATENKEYNGATTYSAEWKGDNVGSSIFQIGTKEKFWPLHAESTTDTIQKCGIAVAVTLLTILLFFLVMKVLVPLWQSKTFEIKYYKKYVPDANVSRRICHYCKQEITPGQSIVVRCKHIMHVHCWQQNGYKCAEYGQNCKIGIQRHVEWSELFTMSSLRDCHQTISGIIAGFISWLIFELSGRGVFDGISNSLVHKFYTATEGTHDLSPECVSKISAFMTIGLLLGFFLSFIFRYNDEYRSKDWKIMLKELGLSILTSFMGMLVFAIGAIVLCLMVSGMDCNYIPWYCSMPAYLFFSITVALALTVQSTIPLKSALLGGCISAIIGFLVLYFSSFAGKLNMLLDFIIYGGGLGASLVTVRMLAEKYFLVIQNGVKAGQRIPIHKWMNATGGGNTVTIGMAGDCEIQMNWEKSNKVAKQHAELYIDYEKQLPVVKALTTGVVFNNRMDLSAGKPVILTNGDNFKIGDTIFQYIETE